MRLFTAASFIRLFSCTGNGNKEAEKEVKLNASLLELIAYLNDSVAPCPVWLAQDYKRRSFFNEDSAAEALTDKFTHDQILSWYQSLDSTDLIDASFYLEEQNIPLVIHQDSIRECASAINEVAFSHENTEAMVLFAVFKKPINSKYTLLLERASTGESWYVADTIQHATF